MIDINLLHQFVAVADELHFGRAAKRLHMTQPPLTTAIQRLEREVGTALFTRTSRTVQLTAAGAALVVPVQRLLRAADDLPRLAQAAATGLSGQLRLGFVSSIAYGPLPDWLRSFRELHPDVVVELHEATIDVQLDAFTTGGLDAGFVLHAPDATPPGLGHLGVLDEPLVLAMPSDHPLARSKRLTIAAALREPLVIFPRTIAPSLFDAILSSYRAHDSTPRISQEAIQMQTIVNLVSAGMGVAWVPESMTLLQRPGVDYRAVSGAGLRCQTTLVWPEPAAPVVERFTRHVAERLTNRTTGRWSNRLDALATEVARTGRDRRTQDASSPTLPTRRLPTRRLPTRRKDPA